MFGLDNDQLMRLLYLVALLAFVLGGIGFRRGERGTALRSLSVWVLIVLGLVTAYAYRAPLLSFAEPVLRELDPSRAVQVVDGEGGSELVVRRGSDGHFSVDAAANGSEVRFLVDTGATLTVLTAPDALEAGIDISALAFDRPVQTANGIAFYARATLDSLELGPYRLTGVPVGIMPGEALSTSLLGMNVIDRFATWRIEGDRMVLVP